jgi:hypothetical protein
MIGSPMVTDTELLIMPSSEETLPLTKPSPVALGQSQRKPYLAQAIVLLFLVLVCV